MVLDFTPKAIMKLEMLTGKPITQIIADYSMTNLVSLVSAGLSVDENKALEELDAYFKNGGEMHLLYVDILQGLQDKGFLPKGLDLKAVKAQMTETLSTQAK